MDLATFLQAMQQSEQAAAQNDPYTGFSNVVNGVQWNPQDYSMGENVVGGLAKGLLGGLFGNLSQDYRAEQQKDVYDTMFQVFKNPDMGAPDGMELSVFQPLQKAAKLSQIASTLEDSDYERKLTGDLAKIGFTARLQNGKQGSDDLLKGIFGDNRASLSQKLQVASKLGLIDGSALEGMQVGEEPNAKPVRPPSRFGGGPTIADKLKDLTEEYSKVASPGTAGELAKAALGADLAINKSAVKRVEEARASASKLGELIAKAEVGISGAGETGGLLGGARNLGAGILSAFGNDDQTEKLAKQAVLDSIAPEIIGANKYPGSVTDFDAGILLGSGPGSKKTPAENREILNNMKAIKDVQEQYADFADAFVADQGSMKNADKLWAQYMKANPLAIKGDDGKVTINPKRQPWDTFEFDLSVLGGDGATAQTSQKSSSTALTPDQARALLKARGIPGY